MVSPNEKETTEKFINFMMLSLYQGDITKLSICRLPLRSDIYCVHIIPSSIPGMINYGIRMYKLIEINSEKNFVELEDSKGNYFGKVQFDKNGKLTFFKNEETQLSDILEKTFLTYKEALKYITNLKFVFTLNNDIETIRHNKGF
jgi:hypothetical protein